MTEIQKKMRTTSNQVSNDVNNALYDVYKMGIDKGFADGKKYAIEEMLENLETAKADYRANGFNLDIEKWIKSYIEKDC